MTRTAAGLLIRAASRLPRVCGLSSSATPWRASSSERSRSFSASAREPSRWASAAVAWSRALPRWSSATRPATTASTSSAATPASTARRRRCERSLAARLVVHEVALDALELLLVGRRPVERGGEPRAAVELAGIAAARVPLARRDAEVVVQAPAVDVLLEPARAVEATRAAAPRARPPPRRGRRSRAVRPRARRARRHRRARARARRAARAGARRRRPRRRPPAARGSPARAPAAQGRGRRRHARPAARPRRGRRRRGRRPRASGGRPRAPATARAGRSRAAAARPGSPLTSATSASTSAASTRRPARCAGRLDRAAQLVAAHRADRDVAGAEHPPQLRVARAAPVEVGAQGDQHERAAARVAHRRDERVGERGPLGLVVAGGEDLLELVDRDDEPAVAARRPRSPARARGRDARRAAAARPPSRRCRGARPARARAAGPRAAPTTCRSPRGRRCPAAARPRRGRPSRRRGARGRRRRRRRRRRTARGP